MLANDIFHVRNSFNNMADIEHVLGYVNRCENGPFIFPVPMGHFGTVDYHTLNFVTKIMSKWSISILNRKMGYFCIESKSRSGLQSQNGPFWRRKLNGLFWHIRWAWLQRLVYIWKVLILYFYWQQRSIPVYELINPKKFDFSPFHN